MNMVTWCCWYLPRTNEMGMAQHWGSLLQHGQGSEAQKKLYALSTFIRLVWVGSLLPLLSQTCWTRTCCRKLRNINLFKFSLGTCARDSGFVSGKAQAWAWWICVEIRTQSPHIWLGVENTIKLRLNNQRKRWCIHNAYIHLKLYCTYMTLDQTHFYRKYSNTDLWKDMWVSHQFMP